MKERKRKRKKERGGRDKRKRGREEEREKNNRREYDTWIQIIRDWPRLVGAVATTAVPDPRVEEHDTTPADLGRDVVGESGISVEPVPRRQVGVRSDVELGRPEDVRQRASDIEREK